MAITFVSTLTPKFTHDCDQCEFVGTIKARKSYFGAPLVDIYKDAETVIVRFGDEPQENKTYEYENIIGSDSKALQMLSEAILSKPVWNSSLIRERLERSDKWVIEAVLRIFEYQTAEEQNNHSTHEDNGVGFNGVDAELLSSYAVFAKRTGTLTKGQMVYARKKILKYSGQLAEIANRKDNQTKRAA